MFTLFNKMSKNRVDWRTSYNLHENSRRIHDKANPELCSRFWFVIYICTAVLLLSWDSCTQYYSVPAHVYCNYFLIHVCITSQSRHPISLTNLINIITNVTESLS
ncbi:hypothetical protein NP493_216g03013 [Ridgeia piscesae]|uniref:Uncharacterized protein n=1 Tax=Ridgeia piscesae TaxID=27915 RepID=A0AAD9P0R3_RIDPI|nr:hypothetical protein NP493_216g03013 [Ridgeia piscesae]